MALPTVKRLGVTVLPEYVQSEGIEQILDNVHAKLGATSITTSPYVAQECDAGSGSREPPIDDGEGKSRLLERPLWGKREVWMETAPSFVPDVSKYEGSPYQPDPATELTSTQGGQICALIIRAKERGLTTYLQVMAAVPPCYRVQFGGPFAEDQPLLPSGKPVPDRVDKNASLASEGLRKYVRGMIADLCANYPECDGFKFDWPEYPPYHFQSIFADYNPQVAPYAAELGIDLDGLSKAMMANCPSEKLRTLILEDAPVDQLVFEMRDSDAGLDDHFRLREHLTASYARFLYDAVAEENKGSKKVFLQGFPPPWHLLSGFDPRRLASYADEIAIKFYTMHWPMIGENYCAHVSEMLDVDRSILASYFRKHFMGAEARPENLHYPAPEIAHNVDATSISKKIEEFAHPGVIGISHTYGPTDDVVERFRALMSATNGNVELNRYAYMTDNKIKALAKVRGEKSTRNFVVKNNQESLT